MPLAMLQALYSHPTRLLNEFREAQISPSIVVIIIILTIIFFLSGCLHLLIRCLVMRHPRRDPNSIVTLTAFQGQLQQLFHLHDSGVEQAFIDTLPVFLYKSVKGLKEGADCAVCLCEFDAEERLRLLPKCSHAFHMDCIDTWLLSHSTCPLCRRSLLPDEMGVATLHHQGLLLDSSRSSLDAETMMRTGVGGGDGEHSDASNVEATWSADQYGAVGRNAGHSPDTCSMSKPNGEISQDENASVSFPAGHSQRQYAGKVLAVQLGRFRVAGGNPNPSSTGMSSSITGSRRSYSVGSYEYVLDPSNLEVVIAPTPLRKRSNTPRRLPAPGHRSTLSDCKPEDVLPDPVVTPFDDAFFRHSRDSPAFGLHCRPLKPDDDDRNWVSVDLNSTSHTVEKSIKPLKPDNKLSSSSSTSSSRRAFSFRLPLSHDSIKLKISASRRTLSEAEVCPGGGGNWNYEDHRSLSGAQLVSESTELSNRSVPPLTSSSIRGAAGAPYSFAKKTFNWLVGKQQKWAPTHTSSSQDNSAQQV